jgi:hypothetical protein
MTSVSNDPYDWTALYNKQGSIFNFDGLMPNEELKDIIFDNPLEAQHVMILVNSYNSIPSAKVNWFILEKDKVNFFVVVFLKVQKHFPTVGALFVTPFFKHKLFL